MKPQGEDDFAASCDKAKTTASPKECEFNLGLDAETKELPAPSQRKAIALDIPFYRTAALVRTYRPIMRNWQSPLGSQLPVCPSTAHNRDLGRFALLRFALSRSKWFRKQCGVRQDFWYRIRFAANREKSRKLLTSRCSAMSDENIPLSIRVNADNASRASDEP